MKRYYFEYIEHIKTDNMQSCEIGELNIKADSEAEAQKKLEKMFPASKFTPIARKRAMDGPQAK